MKWAEVDPQGLEMQQRQYLFNRIKKQVNVIFPEAELCMFGSTSSGLALKGSDIDLLVFYPAVKISVLYD